MPQFFKDLYTDITTKVQSVVIKKGTDTRMYACSIIGGIITKDVVMEHKSWGRATWAPFISISWSILFWQAIQIKLFIDYQAKRRDYSFLSRYSLYRSTEETISPTILFYHFTFALRLLCSSLGKGLV